MAADGQIVFEISADGKHAIASVKQVTDAIKTETRKWDQSTETASGNITKYMTRALDINRIKDWGIEAGKALIQFGKEAIQAASDLQEVQNVVDVTFGSNANQIEKWAKQAGTQFGLTETQAKQFTSTLGAMMKSAGLSGNEIVQMSTDLSGLAADMASFYNLDFDTAFQKIRSGISGETEPLKQLGINMSVANLEAFALAQGIEKTVSEMSQGELTMLRYQYLMQATSDAQGDFARTSDGFANAQRRVEASIETIKTTLGTAFLTVVGDATNALAGFLENLTAEPEYTVLDEFGKVDADTTQKLAELEATYGKAQSVVDLLKEISQETTTLGNGQTISFGDLFGDLAEVEKSGGNVTEYLQGLGADVDTVTHKYGVWKESTKQLTGIIPELNRVIDQQTGSINGGTDALQKNLDEWKANEEKKVAWSAIYAKQRALEEKKAELFSYEFDAGSARQAANRARAAIENVWGQTFKENGRDMNVTEEWVFGLDEDQAQKLQADLNHYYLLLDEAEKKEKELTRQTGIYAEAEQQVADGIQATAEKYGLVEEAATGAADATGDYLGRSTEQWKETTTAVQGTLQALSDYVKGVRDATESAVNSTLSGFNHIDTAAKQYKDAANAVEEYRKELEESGKYTQAEIEIKVNDKNAQVTLQGMTEGLKSQLAFIEEYQRNLQRARELGVSDDVLAQLADGSQDSALKLHAITEAYADWDGQGVPEDIKELNALYGQVAEGKTAFTDDLTQQKLTVDQTYQAMVDAAKNAITEMNLSEEAATASGNTVAGIAKGISDHVSDVSSAVDSIIAELNRLNGFGINIDLGSFGSFGFQIDGFNLDGSHETGLNYVPFDGYLAELHQGEGILTAEENRIWQRFKDGQGTAAVDYDALGGVMRDNVKAGGNVYLDGRPVGRVMSQVQGDQYRSLKRSGWQQ